MPVHPCSVEILPHDPQLYFEEFFLASDEQLLSVFENLIFDVQRGGETGRHRFLEKRLPMSASLSEVGFSIITSMSMSDSGVASPLA